MIILGIETSCDETAVAVVEDGRIVLSNQIASTKDLFANAGGVVPEHAARKQLECILPVLHAALKTAAIKPQKIDAIAVTKGPGLLGSLLVGTITSRTLARLWGKPLLGVHHTFGHLSSTFLGDDTIPHFPIISLSASGGHSDIWYRTAHTKGTLIGATRDDAAGEAFDKGAAMLNLPYPGGPSIAKEALQGNDAAFSFPLPLQGEQGYDFSFSGLKTALKYTLRDTEPRPRLHADLAASFERAICEQLLDRTLRALADYPETKEVHLVGGVSANSRLRHMFLNLPRQTRMRVPVKLAYCTDNAAMIAGSAYWLHKELGEAAYTSFFTASTLSLESCVSKVTIKRPKTQAGVPQGLGR